MDDYLKELRAIDTNNYFISYIIERVQKDDYRGYHFSQHYRKDLELIVDVLESIKITIGDDYFEIPRGDYKNYKNLLDINYLVFSNIIKKIKEKTGKVKPDSLKKILLVDLQRMGFINRYDENKKITDGGHGQVVHYGKLTPMAIDFINGILTERYQILTYGLNIYFGNFLSDIINTIYYSDLKYEKISVYELMFILTDKNNNLDKYKLIKSYRSLSKEDKPKVIKLIRKYADPKRFKGNKKILRDFHNWKNQSQDLLALFKTTIYFEADENGFLLNVSNLGIFDGKSKRSTTVKNDYFLKHKIKKDKDFQLHHIIPIKIARTREEFKLIDNYKNLIYLSKSIHKKINDDEHLVVNFFNGHIKLFSIHQESYITIIKDKDAFYSLGLSQKIERYNIDLLKSFFQFNGENLDNLNK